MRLENVVGWGFSPKPSIWVQLLYFGELTDNRRCTRNRWSGVTVVRRSVVKWMEDLAWLLKLLCEQNKLVFKPPITVKVDGYFRDRRAAPDLHNLAKAINDSVQNGIGVDDKHFRFVSGASTFGAIEPMLTITVEQCESS